MMGDKVLLKITFDQQQFPGTLVLAQDIAVLFEFRHLFQYHVEITGSDSQIKDRFRCDRSNGCASDRLHIFTGVGQDLFKLLRCRGRKILPFRIMRI